MGVSTKQAGVLPVSCRGENESTHHLLMIFKEVFKGRG